MFADNGTYTWFHTLHPTGADWFITHARGKGEPYHLSRMEFQADASLKLIYVRKFPTRSKAMAFARKVGSVRLYDTSA